MSEPEHRSLSMQVYCTIVLLPEWLGPCGNAGSGHTAFVCPLFLQVACPGGISPRPKIDTSEVRRLVDVIVTPNRQLRDCSRGQLRQRVPYRNRQTCGIQKLRTARNGRCATPFQDVTMYIGWLATRKAIIGVFCKF